MEWFRRKKTIAGFNLHHSEIILSGRYSLARSHGRRTLDAALRKLGRDPQAPTAVSVERLLRIHVLNNFDIPKGAAANKRLTARRRSGRLHDLDERQRSPGEAVLFPDLRERALDPTAGIAC